MSRYTFLSSLVILVNLSCVDTVLLEDFEDASVSGAIGAGNPYAAFNDPYTQSFDRGGLTTGVDPSVSVDMTPPVDMMPPQELCNHMDDDQDGEIDEGLLNDCGQCPDEVTPEICDGIDNDCNQQIDEGSCPCPSFVEGDSVYLFCNNRSSWDAAQMTCAQHDFHLASVQTIQENDFLFGEMRNQQFSDTWIGLNDQAQEGRFEWSDGSLMNYTKWGNGEPNNGGGSEDCGIILMENRQSDWDDRPCSRNYSFICEREIP